MNREKGRVLAGFNGSCDALVRCSGCLCLVDQRDLSEHWAKMHPRTIIFAGLLGYGDFAIADDRAEIDRRIDGKFATRQPDLLLRSFTVGNVPLSTSAAGESGPAVRSPRSALLVRELPWTDEAGSGIHQICERLMPEVARRADAGDFLPGAALEAWLLPVVKFTLDFLVTPVDES